MASKKKFNFGLGDTVKATLTTETGRVIGRAHYERSAPSYFVEYVRADGVRADGVQSEAWFDEAALVLVSNAD